MTENEAVKTKLAAAIERLYVEFRGYSHDHETSYCPHCVSEAEVALLYARPLRELGAEDLEKYAFKAMTTWGDTRDFRYFLPRIFELLTYPPETALQTEPEIAVGKLDYGKWQTWPENEQQAVTAFLKAWLRWLLTREFTGSLFSTLSDCVESIALVEVNLQSYLAIWREDFFANKNARLNTAAFLDHSQAVLYKGELFWKANRAQAAQIIEWLLEPEVLPLLEQTSLEFLDTYTDREFIETLEGGVNALETLKMLYD